MTDLFMVPVYCRICGKYLGTDKAQRAWMSWTLCDEHRDISIVSLSAPADVAAKPEPEPEPWPIRVNESLRLLLKENGYTSWSQVVAVDDKALLAVDGIGKKRLKHIRSIEHG